MLNQLYIKNYAIIDELKIEFSEGLNIITGETGAGKSIIINALALILGNRASKSIIRDGQKKCVIEAFFLLDKSYQNYFDENELDFETETTIRREITDSGKSRIFINDTPATLQTVKDLTAILIDFNSQYQKFALLNPEYQLETLDKYAGNAKKISKYQTLFHSFSSNKSQLKKAEKELVKITGEMDYIQFQINELDEANLNKEDEFEQLEIEQKKIVNFEALSSKFQEANETGMQLSEFLRTYQQTLREICRIEPNLEENLKRVDSLLIEFDDVKNEIENADSLEFIDAERQQIVEERLSLLYKLITKHQVKSVADLIAIQNKLSNETDFKNDLEKEINKLTKLVETEKIELKKQAESLQKIRIKTAKTLENQIVSNLIDVGIANATVNYVFKESINLSNTGMDEVDLIFSANPGFEAKPLRENASGGEISRFMLIIKNILSAKMKTETMILDEIDAGISGAAATMVADKLEILSEKQQIICITHLPQVASKGKHHFYVQKGLADNKTFTSVKLLEEQERISVIAELLGLKTAGEKAIANAKELLKI